jgi:hypothetical protein
MNKEDFDKTLQEIERYLTNGDWTLAGYWVRRIMSEYNDLIIKEWKLEKKKIGAEQAREVEKKD